jgi:hypothetical protein
VARDAQGDIATAQAAHDSIDLDHFEAIRTAVQFVAVITSGAHGDATIALGHGDRVTIAGMTEGQFHAIAQSAIYLH